MRYRLVGIVSLILLVLTLVWSNLTQAAEVNFVRVRCDSTRVRGETEVRAPFVRITVTLASDLTVTLAEKVVKVNRYVGARFNTELYYPQQPAGTLLIVSVGEWSGTHYLKPATLLSRYCDELATPTPLPSLSPTFPPDFTPMPFPTSTPTFTPSFVPTGSHTSSRTLPPPTRTSTPTASASFTPTPLPTDTPDFPPVTPTIIVTSTLWDVTSTLLEDTCGVGEQNMQFPATLVLAGDGTVLSLSALELTFPLQNLGSGGYFSQITVGEVTYTLNINFFSSDLFGAGFFFTMESIPGCHTLYSWQGVSTG